MIVADLPIEAAPDLRRVQLVAPTTPAGRIRLAAERTDGWLYLVSVTGTTGARASASTQLGDLVGRARAVTDALLLAGFGISTPEQAAEAASLADGIVVGSALSKWRTPAGRTPCATTSPRFDPRSMPRAHASYALT